MISVSVRIPRAELMTSEGEKVKLLATLLAEEVHIIPFEGDEIVGFDMSIRDYNKMVDQWLEGEE